MFNGNLLLSFEQQLKKERGYKKEMDFRAFKNDAPKAPTQVKSTYSNGFGDSGSQDEFKPSEFNASQMNYYKNAVPKLQEKLYDFNGADSQAKAQADAVRSNGLKRFGKSMDDSFGSDIANVAHRFGSLNNSTMDSMTKRFGAAKADGLEAIQNDYDANYQNNLSNIQNYNMNNLNSAENGISNLYNLASGNSQHALNSSNATNTFNLNNYQNVLSDYERKKAEKNGMYSQIGTAVGSVGGFLIGGPAGAYVGSQIGSQAGNLGSNI